MVKRSSNNLELFNNKQLYEMHLAAYSEDMENSKKPVGFDVWAHKQYDKNDSTLDILIDQHAQNEVDKFMNEINFVTSPAYQNILKEAEKDLLEEKVETPRSYGPTMQKVKNLLDNPKVRKAGRVAASFAIVAGMLVGAGYLATQNTAAEHTKASGDYTVENISNDDIYSDQNPVLFEDSLVWIKKQSGNFDIMYKNLTSVASTFKCRIKSR